MFKTLILLVAVVCVVNAWVDINTVPLVPKPEKYKHQDGCYIPELDQVVSFGGIAPSISACMGYACNITAVEYLSCISVVAVLDGCIIPFDKETSDPYPACCENIKCI